MKSINKTLLSDFWLFTKMLNIGGDIFASKGYWN